MESDAQIEARAYEQQAHVIEQQGDHSGAIRLMERALMLRAPQNLGVGGGDQAERLLAAERLVVKYNTVAVRCFKNDDYETALTYLNNALRMTEPGQPHFDHAPEERLRLRGTSFNNLGCLERRRGRLEMALNYLQLAVEHGGNQSASTFLNMSAILSQLGRPAEAAGAARRAVGLLEASGSEQPGVLPIAYHNLAMALESIEPEAAGEAYWRAFELAKSELGATSSTTQAIEKNMTRFAHQSRRVIRPQQSTNTSLPPLQNRSSSQARGRVNTNIGHTRAGASTQSAEPASSFAIRLPPTIQNVQPSQHTERSGTANSQTQRSRPLGSLRSNSEQVTGGIEQTPPSTPKGNVGSSGYQPAPPGGRRSGPSDVASSIAPQRRQSQDRSAKFSAALPKETERETNRAVPRPPADRPSGNRAPPIRSVQPGDSPVDKQLDPQSHSAPHTQVQSTSQGPAVPSGSLREQQQQPEKQLQRQPSTPTVQQDQLRQFSQPQQLEPKRDAPMKPQPPQSQAGQQARSTRFVNDTAPQPQQSAQQQQPRQMEPSSLGVGEDGRKEDLLTFLTNRLNAQLKAEEEFEQRYVSAVKIQCLARRINAKKKLSRARQDRMNRTFAQQSLEGKASAKVCKFFRLILLKRKDITEKQQQEQKVKDVRHDAAVKIQSIARRWLAKNRVRRLRIYYRDYNKSLRVLQCWFRQLLAKKKVKSMRNAKSSATVALLTNEKRNRSACDIQRLFRAYRAMSGTNKLRGTVRAANEKERQSSRVYGAKRIQCAWRGFVDRRFASSFADERLSTYRKIDRTEIRRFAVITIQRLVRGLLSRRRTRGIKEVADARKAVLLEKKRNVSAIRIQCQIRRFLSRRQLRRKREIAQVLQRNKRHGFQAIITQQWCRGALSSCIVQRRIHARLLWQLDAIRAKELEAAERSAADLADEQRRQREKEAVLQLQAKRGEWRQTICRPPPVPAPLEPTVVIPTDEELELEILAANLRAEAAAKARGQPEPIEDAGDQEDAKSDHSRSPPAADAEGAEEEGEQSPAAQRASSAEPSPSHPAGVVADEVDSDPHDQTPAPLAVPEEEAGQPSPPTEQEPQEEPIVLEPLVWPKPTEPPVSLSISIEHRELRRKEALAKRIEERLAKIEQRSSVDPIATHRELVRKNGAARRIQALIKGFLCRRRMILTRLVIAHYIDALVEDGREEPIPVQQRLEFNIIDEVESSMQDTLGHARRQMHVGVIQRQARKSLAEREVDRRREQHWKKRDEASRVLAGARKMLLAKQEVRTRQQQQDEIRQKQIEAEEAQLAALRDAAAVKIQSSIRQRQAVIKMEEEKRRGTLEKAHAVLVGFFKLILAKRLLRSRQKQVQDVLQAEARAIRREAAAIRLQSFGRTINAKQHRDGCKKALLVAQERRVVEEAAEPEVETSIEPIAPDTSSDVAAHPIPETSSSVGVVPTAARAAAEDAAAPPMHASADEEQDAVKADAAATRIQAVYRGHIARVESKKRSKERREKWLHQAEIEAEELQELEGLNEAAATVQKNYRMFTAKKEVARLRAEQETEVQNEAASKVQRGFKVYTAKKEADRRRVERSRQWEARRNDAEQEDPHEFLSSTEPRSTRDELSEEEEE